MKCSNVVVPFRRQYSHTLFNFPLSQYPQNWVPCFVSIVPKIVGVATISVSQQWHARTDSMHMKIGYHMKGTKTTVIPSGFWTAKVPYWYCCGKWRPNRSFWTMGIWTNDWKLPSDYPLTSLGVGGDELKYMKVWIIYVYIHVLNWLWKNEQWLF